MEQITTICAISTPPGRGGIAICRVSGPQAIDIVNSLWQGKRLSTVVSHTAHYGNITNDKNETLDQAVVTVFRSPKSFTGENVVEISVHGSIYIQQALLESLVARGARIAEPGEFTRRAFINGRIDLAEAEAVADMIASSSAMSHALAVRQLEGQFSGHINRLRDELISLASLLELELDFSEEDVEFADRTKLKALAQSILRQTTALAKSFRAGNAIKEGVNVAIVGRPNAGKSSLLNALLCSNRAIVSDIPGTTRDTIEDTVTIDGIIFRFIDTAGLRDTDNPIEALGIERALSAISSAQFVIWLIPPELSKTNIDNDLNQIKHFLGESTALIPVYSKADLMPVTKKGLSISSTTGLGLNQLKRHLVRCVLENMPEDAGLVVTNARHHALLLEANTALKALISGIDDSITSDLLAEHLREALNALAAITGQITSDTILATIFERFCIGK